MFKVGDIILHSNIRQWIWVVFDTLAEVKDQARSGEWLDEKVPISNIMKVVYVDKYYVYFQLVCNGQVKYTTIARDLILEYKDNFKLIRTEI
jgi:hypothetical protein